MRSVLFGLLLALAVTGCASSPTPPPEPDMSNLVDVNRYVPEEIDRTKVQANATGQGSQE